MYLITMGEAIGWQCLPGNTLSRSSPQGQEGQQFHRYQDVPDYHEGGKRLAVLTGQHSEQKAVPRDRKVTRPAITQMYLIKDKPYEHETTRDNNPILLLF
jgi:hypothetical protein